MLFARPAPPGVIDGHSDCKCNRPGIMPYAIWLGLAAYLLLQRPFEPGREVLVTWICVFLLVTGCVVLVSWEWTSTWRGAVVSRRNTVSTGHLQSLLWLLVLASTVIMLLLLGAGWKFVEAEGDSVQVPLRLDVDSATQVGIAVAATAGGGAALAAKRGKGISVQATKTATAGMAAAFATEYVTDLQPKEHIARMPAEDNPRLASWFVQEVGLEAATSVFRAVVRDEPNLQATVGLLHHHYPDFTPINAFKLAEAMRAAVLALAEKDVRNSESVVYANKCQCQARFRDALEGDEVGNAWRLDPAKLQFAIVTLLGLVTYTFSATAGFHAIDGLADLRETSIVRYPDEMMQLLGLSSAGYVGSKVPTHTKQ